MKKITCAISTLLFMFIHILGFSQQGNVWTLGAGALVDFNNGGPIIVGNSNINSYEGCASISDDFGNLVLYTDGITVWDGSGNQITTGLSGHWSAAQSGIIVPEPGTIAGTYTNRYYIFSIPDLGSGLVTYTIIDMSGIPSVVVQNGTMPDVVTPNNTTEGITVARNCDNDAFWVITHEMGNNTFKSYKLTNGNLAAPVLSNVGPPVPTTGGNINGAACMKISPDNDELAFIVRESSVDLYDFDPNTGMISNQTNVATGTGRAYYGVEFSQSGDVLYYTDIVTGIYGYDIIGGNTPVDLSNIVPSTSNIFGALQLAPNGIIYMARDGDIVMNNLNQPFLGGINMADNLGLASFNATQLPLAPGTGSKVGLPNIIPTVNPPQLTIAGNTVLCSGESATLTVSGGDNYTWTPSPTLTIVAGTNNTQIIANPTSTETYFVESIVNGCEYMEQITVVVENCCSAATDSLFQTPPTNINTDTYWTEKMYIPDGVIVTVSNAILDITNVDVVFGECAGIDFVDGAILRANNSVFRPCNLDDTWRGLRFEGSNEFSHQLNENTFKNAEIALLFEDDAEGEINSNTFSNCNEGIKMNESRFSSSIFENNFLINNEYPVFTNCYSTTSPNDIIHIHGIGVNSTVVQTPEMTIVQNNFTMSNNSGANQTTGIDLMNSSASISENTMTNMEFGIVITDPISSVNVEGNETEYNFDFNPFTVSVSQISLFNSRDIFASINDNELRNSNSIQAVNKTGIFLSNSSNVHIQNNEIQGFHNGINAQESTTLNISENHLSSIRQIAINLVESPTEGTNFITCNDITMVMNSGVGISTSQASRFTEISSNCIKDALTGIRVNGSGDIPVIRNNYLYNYSQGIVNIGHTGNIGTASNPGMNTLWSNNNSAFDVASFGSNITIANNFGMFNCTWATVSITGNNPLHSTASCGQQIFNMPSQGSLNTSYTCDNMDKFILPANLNNGAFKLPELPEAVTFVQSTENKVGSIAKLIQLEDCTQNYLSDLMNQVSLTTEEQSYLWYNFFKGESDFSNAHLHLSELTSANYSDFVTIETLVLKKLNGTPFSALDLTIIDGLINDETLNNGIRNQAVGLSKTASAHRYYYISVPVFDFLEFEKTTNIEEEQTTLIVYPNPANDNISIEVLEGKMVEGQTINIFDMQGKIVLETELDFISGKTTIDISKLDGGAYFIMLNSDGNYSERTLFTKL